MIFNTPHVRGTLFGDSSQQSSGVDASLHGRSTWGTRIYFGDICTTCARPLATTPGLRGTRMFFGYVHLFDCRPLITRGPCCLWVIIPRRHFAARRVTGCDPGSDPFCSCANGRTGSARNRSRADIDCHSEAFFYRRSIIGHCKFNASQLSGARAQGRCLNFRDSRLASPIEA